MAPAMERMPTFAELLVRYRREAGFTQEQLAERAHMSVHGISDLERGVKRQPWGSTVKLLETALDLDQEQRALFEAVVARQKAERRRPPAARSSLTLPEMPGRFIDRESAIEEIVALVQQPDVRMVTLVGPPGVGKTRLALQVVHAVTAVYSDSTCFVPLAEVRSVRNAVAGSLGLTTQDTSAIESILTSRAYLLVLDAFEGHRDEAGFLTELSGSCAGLNLLVTSREMLHVAGERSYPVEPLSCSSDDESTGPAVELFLDRARSVRPTFSLTANTEGLAAQVCARLDGLPLAIELAAAQMRYLSLVGLADRLDRQERGDGSASMADISLQAGLFAVQPLAYARQALRDAFDWSYRLLDPEEQRLFTLMAVFAGGATLDAVEAVCGPHFPGDMVALLSGLIDKHLIVLRDSAGEARYAMLHTVHDYARGLLAADEETEREARNRHAAHYLTLAQRRHVGPSLFDQVAWFDRLERETANFAAALQWDESRGNPERGLLLAVALLPFWDVRGHWQEGTRRLDAALAAAPYAAIGTRGNAHAGIAALASRLGDLAHAEAEYGAALFLFRQAGDEKGAARVLDALGLVAAARGKPDEGLELLRESLQLARAQRDDRGMARALNNLGLVYAQQGQYEQARGFYEQSLALKRKVGDRRGMAGTLRNVALAAVHEGKHQEATALLRAGLGVYCSLGDKQNAGLILADLAGVERDQGNGAEARALSREGVELFRQTGNEAGIATILEGLAILAVSEGQPQQAALLFGAAEAARERLGLVLSPDDEARHERALASGEESLGLGSWLACWESGRSLPFAEALEAGFVGVSG